MTSGEGRLWIYVDADVLLAGIATENPGAASRFVLEASELTLLDLVAAQKVIDECERNLSRGAPEEMSLQTLRTSFREAVARAVEVVNDPNSPHSIPETDPKDVIHLACASQQNSRDLQPERLSQELPGRLRG